MIGVAGCFAAGGAQTAAKPAVRPPDVAKTPTKDDLLRGAYGPYRANNDLLFYALKLRVDPAAKTIAGTNLVRFKMLADGQTIQLELTPELTLDAITFEGKALTYTREERSLFIAFPRVLKAGETDDVTVAYHGQPVTQGRFGCFSFDKDKEGKPWITTACEQEGPSVWWPNKDQWRDEPQDGMEIDVAVPNGLMDISNGRFVASKDLGDGYTEWQWRVHYPINNYDVALNIGSIRPRCSLRRCRRCSMPMSTTSGSTPSIRTGTSLSKCRMRGWSTSPLWRTATTLRMATMGATGRAWASR